ncbi:long-chain-fatty-acid--CoA ligase [Candidatus Acetothermia bacterium]|nr:long-chain-fatty-acid--CoA ligase [Candidatus Acetothermia bacterium]
MNQLLLSNLFEQAVQRNSQAVATLCGTSKHTYEQLYERVCRLSNALANLGLDQGDRFVVLMLNCHRYLESYLAAAISGRIIVPLNIRWGAKELGACLQDCVPKAFFLDAVIAQHLTPFLPHLKALGIQHFIYCSDGPPPDGMVSYEELIKNASSEPPTVTIEEDDVLGLFYTSGTTGVPKGVMLTHKNLMMNAYHAQIGLEFRHASVYLHAAPMFHLADGAATWTTTWNGAAHAFIPKFDPADVLNAIQKWRVTNTVLVPTMINLLINHPEFSKYDVNSLSQTLYGASPIAPELLRRAMKALSCRFYQGYGMTEAAPLLTILSPDNHEHALKDPKRTHLLASAGKPLLGVQVRVVDEHDRDVPAGTVGEIIARGPNIMKGYWNKPEQTAKSLRGGWYHSKDMGRFDEEGYLYIVDRKDDMIVTGGENVYSTEVEAVLYEHPAVLEAAVVGVPDETWGEAIKAIVVLRSGAKATETEILEYCKKNLSTYKVPRSLEFIPELPKSGTGKILKTVIRQKYWAGQERRVH